MFSFAYCCIGSKNITVKVSKGILSFFLPSITTNYFVPAVLRQYFVRERWKKSKFKSKKKKKKNSAFDRYCNPGQLPRISSQLLQAIYRELLNEVYSWMSL